MNKTVEDGDRPFLNRDKKIKNFKPLRNFKQKLNQKRSFPPPEQEPGPPISMIMSENKNVNKNRLLVFSSNTNVNNLDPLH